MSNVGAIYSDEVRKKYTRNRTAPFKCRECDYVSDNLTALKMHHLRRHGAVQGAPNKVRNLKATTNGHVEVAEVAQVDGRGKWKRKPKQQVETNVVNYCPQCGCHLAAVLLALSIHR